MAIVNCEPANKGAPRMTMSNMMSYGRLSRVLSRYGTACQIITAAQQDANAPWQVAASKLQPQKSQVLMQAPRYVNRTSNSGGMVEHQYRDSLLGYPLALHETLAFSNLVISGDKWQITRPELLCDNGKLGIFRIDLIGQGHVV